MTLQATNTLEAFNWKPQPAAEKFVQKVVDAFLAVTPAAATLAQRMKDETGTRFFDWIDEITLPRTDAVEKELEAVGYVRKPLGSMSERYVHEGGMFPPIRLGSKTPEIAIKVESVADFAAANGLPLLASDGPLALVRRLPINAAKTLWAVERHGCRADVSPPRTEAHKLRSLFHVERFRTRQRMFANDAEGYDVCEKLIDAAIEELGVDVACDLFFAAEREFWQRRNRAAQFQKSRQDRLGLGWANHDHHTYRSSRQFFARQTAIFEKLGFHCRERFYAGREAGWGAQVLEQPTAGVVIFADVDMSPEELLNDFAHEPLPPRDHLGTVGLWCGLHGESFLQAGMHHLECQFDFEALRDQMESQGGVKVMKPFTNFPYLRQAFTEGERWSVADNRIAALLDSKMITAAQAEQFRSQGAIGSHLENLERNEGFKGFNQTGVSQIIAATDPRKHLATSV